MVSVIGPARDRLLYRETFRNLSEVLPKTLFCGHRFWSRTVLFQNLRDLGTKPFLTGTVPSPSNVL